MFERNPHREAALGLQGLLDAWPSMPPTLKGLLPGVPSVLQKAIDLLEAVEQRPTFADKAENPALATALGLANVIDESDSAEAQDLADLVRKIPRRPKPVFSMDYIAEALREGKNWTNLQFESQDITHVTWREDSIVLRCGVCDCPCHKKGAIIMHDTPCCASIRPFTYPQKDSDPS
jgi:hypothetical protein